MSDPLDTKTSDIDVSNPVHPGTKSPVEMPITKADITTNDEGQDYLSLQLAMTEAYTATNGEEVQPGAMGSVFFARVPVTVGLYTDWKGNEKERSEVEVAKNITKVAKSCSVLDVTPREIMANPAQLVDKVAKVKIRFRKETEEWPASNQLEFVV